jgi:glycosyltransferase involved in cell wall biosynthesis
MKNRNAYMTDHGIDVSVIIPTFNRCGILRRTLNLYAQQQGINGRFEVILGDDGSSDETIAMLTSAVQTYPFPLRFISLPRNSGPSAARNRAMELAKGHILLFSGDDILPSPRFVAEHFEWHTKSHPEIHIGVLGYARWSPELKITPFMHWLEQNGTQFAYGHIRHGDRIDCGLLHTSNVSFKSDFIKENNEFFDERLRFQEDSEWALRLQKRGMELYYNANALGDHFHPVDLDTSLARMRAVGRSLKNLRGISPENFHRATHGFFAKNLPVKKRALLLLVDPMLGRWIYAPLARLVQRRMFADRLYALAHAASLLEGLRDVMRPAKLSKASTKSEHA